MKKYQIAVTSADKWGEIHEALTLDSNQDGIPDRRVDCADDKVHSPTRGVYELTDESYKLFIPGLPPVSGITLVGLLIPPSIV